VLVCASLPLSLTAMEAAERTRKCGGGEQRMGMVDKRVGPLVEYTPSWTIKPEPASESQQGYRALGLVMIDAVPETDTRKDE